MTCGQCQYVVESGMKECMYDPGGENLGGSWMETTGRRRVEMKREPKACLELFETWQWVLSGEMSALDGLTDGEEVNLDGHSGPSLAKRLLTHWLR